MGVVSRIGGFVGTALLATAIGAEAQAARKPAMKAVANLPKEDLDALVAFLAKKK